MCLLQRNKRLVSIKLSTHQRRNTQCQCQTSLLKPPQMLFIAGKELRLTRKILQGRQSAMFPSLSQQLRSSHSLSPPLDRVFSVSDQSRSLWAPIWPTTPTSKPRSQSPLPSHVRPFRFSWITILLRSQRQYSTTSPPKVHLCSVRHRQPRSGHQAVTSSTS